MTFILSAVLSSIAIVLSLFVTILVLKRQVVVNVINIDGQDIDIKWEGRVLRNVLYLQADGESTIVSDSLLPLHGKTVTVIVLPKHM